jgi:hypothetical protein
MTALPDASIGALAERGSISTNESAHADGRVGSPTSDALKAEHDARDDGGNDTTRLIPPTDLDPRGTLDDRGS